ncbi:hypothetical protein [Porphyrobacter sp. AAP82]|uniref:hypothetical protein n=1 Tax=Porphyrobacter sp. AAP82 TaxID=1248917 RepID=UPI0002DB1B73|nr:hypothetical protein [Porphyrobacter sp. AAP82]
MTPRLLALAPLWLLAAACTPDPAVEAARTQAALDAAPPATVKGPGQSCIDRSAVRNTVVRSDKVIDFEMNGGKVYRSTLKSRCPGLAFDRAITYETSINQLCTQQIVYALNTTGGTLQRGAACSLGEFVPIEYVKE